MPTKKISVVGPGPAWRRGVAGLLDDAGFDTIELEALATWRPGRGAAIALRTPGEEKLGEVADFTSEHRHVPVVAVVPELGASEYAAALRAGCSAAIGEDENADVYGTVFGAALLGLAAMPTLAARTMAARLPRPPADLTLTGPMINQLQALATGATVSELAEASGYSEREMFRLLKNLYTVIGVENRTQAIIWATHHGLLTVDE